MVIGYKFVEVLTLFFRIIVSNFILYLQCDTYTREQTD